MCDQVRFKEVRFNKFSEARFDVKRCLEVRFDEVYQDDLVSQVLNYSLLQIIYWIQTPNSILALSQLLQPNTPPPSIPFSSLNLETSFPLLKYFYSTLYITLSLWQIYASAFAESSPQP